MRSLFGLLLAVLLAVAGCNLNPLSVTEPPAATTEVIAPVDNKASISPAMTTLVDERSGIAFDYPTGWTVSPPPEQPAVAYSYSIASFDFLHPPSVQSKSQQGVPAGETEIQVNFHAADETVESIRSNLQAEVANGTAKILGEQPRTASDGTTAYYYEIQGMFEGTGYLFQTSVNGHTVSVVAYGEGAHFEDVVKSLRAA